MNRILTILSFVLFLSSGLAAQDAAVFPIEEEHEAVRIYPNPADDFVIVSFVQADAGDYVVSLHNIIGNLVETEILQLADTEVRVKLVDLPPGYYFVTMRHTRGAHKMLKFLKR